MSRNTDLIHSLQRIARTLWLKNTLERTLVLGFYATILLAAVLLLTKLGLLAFPYWDYLLILAVGFIAGLGIGLTRRPSLYQTAVFVDDALFLQNRLATGLECTRKTAPNRLETLLLQETEHLRPRLTPALAYQRFNLNYLFQFSLALLGTIILWLLPVGLSPAEESVKQTLQEQSAKLARTAQSLQGKENVDTVTRNLVNRMEALSQAISENRSTPAELLKEITALQKAVRREEQTAETGTRLLQQMTVIFSQSPGQNQPSTPEEINKFVADLEVAVREGRVNVNTINQIKEALKSALNNLPPDSSLVQPLKQIQAALDNPAVSLSEPLKEFIQQIKTKNREVLETMQLRLKITARELQSAQATQSAGATTPATSTDPSRFSLANPEANGNAPVVPLHPSTAPPATIADIPLLPDTPPERITLVKEVLQAKLTALQNPTWSAKYDQIIRDYFK